MLSDEEKKAIERAEFLIKIDTYLEKEMLTNLLNLIEKQSKEIEEYKKQLDLDYVDKHFVPIERYNQLEKEIEELTDKNKKLQDKAKELIFEKQELTSALLDSTPKDKIKAKIEEVDIEIQCCEYADDDTEEYKQDIEKEKRRLLRDKAVLQSLLEKE